MLGSLASKVPKDLDIFVNCSSQLQYFDYAVDLYQQILTTALTLLNFHYVDITVYFSSKFILLHCYLQDICSGSYTMTYENKMNILLCDSKCCKYTLHRTFSAL